MTRATVPGPLTRDPERTRDPGSTLGVQQVRRLRQVDTLYTCAIIYRLSPAAGLGPEATVQGKPALAPGAAK